MHRIIPCGLLWLASVAYARSDEVQPLDQLPATVQAEPGQLTIYADYAGAKDGKIPLFVINRTDKPVDLAAQDGDLYLKLEYQSADGEWKRAQSHAYSWCGNSYMYRPRLEPGTFTRREGYAPAEGIKAKVRYRIYDGQRNLASNVGDGFVLKDEVDRAATDAMNVRAGDFDFVRKVALGEIRLENKADHIRDLRSMAIYRLRSGPFEREKVIKVLTVLAAEESDHGRQAAATLEEMKNEPELR